MRLKNLAFLAAIAVAIPLLVTGCSPKQQEIVASVGEEPITLQDYENLFLKSNGNRDSAVATSMEERQRFLDLMVKYRLKLADARRLKLDQKPEILSEVQQYKGGLAASFITEREITGPGLRRLYQRRGEEIRASHILLTLAPNAGAEDSVKAYTKAYEIIQAAKSGGDFKALALENSQDPSVKQNGGDLYYFTAGQMVAPFEEAAFSMKPGEVTSAPVRTQYGLHIIKLLDRKPAVGEVRCSHIMIRFPQQNPSPDDTAAAYAKIIALEDSLKQGADFAALARRHSEDPGSARNGGDLGFFARRRWVQPFDEVAFTLKPGQLSRIVRTTFGYHLINCTDAKPRKTFEEAKQELQQVYQQLHFQEDYGKLLSRLKEQVRVQRNEEAFAALLAGADTAKTVRDSGATAGVSERVLQSEVVSVGPISLTVDSMLSVMKARPDLYSTLFRPEPLATALDKVTEQLVWTVAADSLERRYPEFASILKDYKEGVLLYQVEQDNVWNKVATNDSALHAYFEANREKFTYPDRVDFSELRMPSEAKAKDVLAQLKQGKTLEEVVAEDSVRMAAPSRFEASFKKGSSSLTAKSNTVLATVAKALQQDSTLRVQVTVLVDTGKAQGKKLVDRRIATVSSQFRKLGIRPDRVITVNRPLSAAQKATGDGMELTIVGRQVTVLGKIEQAVLAPSADERAKRADSLGVEAYSSPFPHRGTFSIVRLNKREPARLKSFEEAGGELSSAFQEAESKRLEYEWMQSLRQRYPVVENKEALKNAFVVAQKQ